MSNNDGVVYTKTWVVDLILDMVGFTADKPLWQQVIVEPSCGEGSFIEQIADRIAASAENANALNLATLSNCVVSFDTDADSVNITRALVADILARHGLSNDEATAISKRWIRCEDYLLADPLSADYVVGNPPYIRATDLSVEQRKTYCSRYRAMSMGCDLYVAFIERGIADLCEGGKLCYICADRWMQNQYGTALRSLVASQRCLEAVVKMHDVDAFEKEVSAYPAVTLLGCGSDEVKYASCSAGFTEKDSATLLDWLRSDCSDYNCQTFEAGLIPAPSDSSILPLTSPDKARLVLELSRQLPALEDSGVKLGIGLATGRDSVFITDKKDLVEPERMLPVFNMRDWRRGRRDKERWLVNPWNEDGSLINLEKYPLTRNYYKENYETLAKRHVAKKSTEGWYRTIDKPKWELLGKPMLLFPDMASKAEPVYTDGSKYPCHNCYWITSEVWDLKVLGGLLMSEFAEAFVDALGVKMRGGTLRFQAQYLRLIHVPRYETLTSDIREALRSAFENGDRTAASEAAKLAYGIQEAMHER